MNGFKPQAHGLRPVGPAEIQMPHRLYFSLLLLPILLSTKVKAEESPPKHWIVVTAPEFRPAIEPLAEHRKAQKLLVTIVETTDVLSPREILTGSTERLFVHLQKQCREHMGETLIVLVGAVEAGTLKDPEKRVVPPLRGTLGRMKGQPSDNGYGCLDKDRLPTVAVGRMPARSLAEAHAMVQKTLAFERDNLPGEWRRRLTMLMGHPGGSPGYERNFAERYVESACLSRADRLLPLWSPQALLHLPQSRFGVPDEALRDRSFRLLQAGQLLTIYAGHSSSRGLSSGGARFLDRDDWASLSIPCGAGVFISCGCFGCQMSGDDGEGYGQAAIRNPNGPVAVIGAHGESYAAIGQLAFDGLLTTLSSTPFPERLGSLWLAVAGGIAKAPIDPLTFNLLDQADGSRGKVPLDLQRQEHLEMWLLLGDPSLRLPSLPLDLELEAGTLIPGKELVVQGKAPARLNHAEVVVVLERRLSSMPPDLQSLPKQSDERSKAMLGNFERANQLGIARQKTVVRDGHFEARLAVPMKLPGANFVLRAYAASDKQEAFGALSLAVPQAKNGIK